MVLMCISLMTSDIELQVSDGICMSSLGKCLFRSPAHFSVRLLVFLKLSCMTSLYILDISHLSGMFANIFSHSVGRLSILLIISFAMQKLFCLM